MRHILLFYCVTLYSMAALRRTRLETYITARMIPFDVAANEMLAVGRFVYDKTNINNRAWLRQLAFRKQIKAFETFERSRECVLPMQLHGASALTAHTLRRAWYVTFIPVVAPMKKMFLRHACDVLVCFWTHVQ